MPCDPYSIVCEILGQPAQQMKNPVNEDYLCPYQNTRCTKRSHRIEGPFPVCSIFRQRKGDSVPVPVAVCPRRLYEADIFNDVINYCWAGARPSNPIIVHEIKMGKVGNVDMVIAEVSSDGQRVTDFISVELQAIDITGTYEPAYSAIVLNTELERRPIYNFNYRNVQKRFITQLIDKGFYHHHWGTKIVAVVQDVVYENLLGHLNLPEVDVSKSNVVFMRYGMVSTKSVDGMRYEMKLKAVTGTTHNNLMMNSFYQITPPKDEFCERIMKVHKAGMQDEHQ